MMVKVVFCLRRKADLSPEEFQTYWKHIHGPMVHERARNLGIRRYVQSHRLYDPRLGALAADRGFAGEPFDGVAEIWFDSAEILYPSDCAPAASIQAGRDLLADEGDFIDLENSPIFVVQEHEIFDRRR